MKDKVFCKVCKGDRNHTEIHNIEERGGEEESDFQYIHKFSLIKCNGCDNISFLESLHYSFGDPFRFS